MARAVADGVITQAQADAVLAQESNFGLFGGHGRGGRGHHGRGGPWSLPSLPDSDSDDATTDTNFDA